MATNISMTESTESLQAQTAKRVLIVASDPAVSDQTGWPIGFWWEELTHSYREFTEAGYQVVIASPKGGRLQADDLSDPRDERRLEADDLLSLGFINSPEHMALLDDVPALSEIDVNDFDAVFLVGGQGPMYTFVDDPGVHALVRAIYEAGKVTAVICHATSVLLRTTLSSGELLVKGKTWTGFANSEEDFADSFVGQKLQPFRIEDEARSLEDTNFIVQGPFKPHAVRDGNLITGQQQASASATARLVIEALGK
ncbi:MAG: type 1 glutamine amidotransferase domain-containing protein [Solirubrobacteraceae bacterium]